MRRLSGLTAIAYIRVSTSKQELGPEAQSESIRKWCIDNGVKLVGERREVCSGSTAISKRPLFIEAAQEVDVEKIDYLVVAKRDRLARDVVQAGIAEQLITSVGGRVVSVDDPTGNRIGPEGHLIRTILDAMAEFERARIRVRIREAMAVKLVKNERRGSLPYGKGLAPDGVHHVTNASETHVLEIVKSMRTGGASCPAIRQELTKQGYLSRAGTMYTNTSIGRMCDRVCPEYEAELRRGRAERRKVED